MGRTATRATGRAAQAALTEALEGAGFGFAVLGADGAPAYANAAWRAMTAGLPPAAAADAEPHTREGRILLRERRPLPSGETAETLTDVTAIRQREAELEAARARADTANTAKSQFISVMSHELRTPMNGVLGFAGLLASTDLDDRQRRWLDYVCESAELLLRVLNGILDLATLEGEGLALDADPLDPAAVARDALAAQAQAAAQKGLALSFEAPPGLPVVLGDARRLTQALDLLLDNAVKFTARGGVTLRLSAAPAPPGQARLCYEVADTGPGIAPAAMARLFEPFTQADSSATRGHGGIGIGLALCSRLARAMGGTVEAGAAPGGGARLRLRIPHARPPGTP